MPFGRPVISSLFYILKALPSGSHLCLGRARLSLTIPLILNISDHSLDQLPLTRAFNCVVLRPPGKPLQLPVYRVTDYTCISSSGFTALAVSV